MITSRDISVVVQGPIMLGGPGMPCSTAAALASVRKVLPEAELILSTWPGQDLTGLSPDVLVQPADPGPQLMDATGQIARKYNNVNRQIVSTTAGLRAATRPWAVKLRSDVAFTHNGFLRFLVESTAREEQWKIFSDRVVVCEVGCANPRLIPALFNVTDIFHTGRTADLRQLWDIPLAPEPETSQWMIGKPRPWVVWTLDGFFLRYSPEQFIWISCLQRHGRSIQLQHCGDAPLHLAWQSERFFLNNFHPVSLGELGIQLPERLAAQQTVGTNYTTESWSRLIDTTILRRPSLRFWLKFNMAILICRMRYLWRNFASSHAQTLLVRSVRGILAAAKSRRVSNS